MQTTSNYSQNNQDKTSLYENNLTDNQTPKNIKQINEDVSLFCIFSIIILLTLFLNKTKLVKF
jgi:hypothetical protein